MPDLQGRHFVALLITALKFYQRHQATLAGEMPSGVADAIEVLIAAIPLIEALNPAGPE